MAQATDYTALIPSANGAQPKFTQMVSLIAGAFADSTNSALSIEAAFDLDAAAGPQLDAIGLWVGLSRQVPVALSGIYFAFDTPGVGFDQGSWQGPYDPTTGLTSLDDTTYRTMLRIKIAVNNWDGTFSSFQSIVSRVLAGYGATAFCVDNQDMSASIYIGGNQPPAVVISLLRNGYFSLKPEGVHLYYFKTSAPPAPLFGFDVSNSFIAGFDTGAWATSL